MIAADEPLTASDCSPHQVAFGSGSGSDRQRRPKEIVSSVSSTGGDPASAGAVHPNMEDLWWAKAIARRMHAGVVTGAEPGHSPGYSPGYSPGAEARRVSSELMRAREARVALLFERARRATRAPFRAIPQPPMPEPIPRRRRAERPAPHPPLRLLWASPGFQMGNSLAEFVEARHHKRNNFYMDSGIKIGNRNRFFKSNNWSSWTHCTNINQYNKISRRGAIHSNSYSK